MLIKFADIHPEPLTENERTAIIVSTTFAWFPIVLGVALALNGGPSLGWGEHIRKILIPLAGISSATAAISWAWLSRRANAKNPYWILALVVVFPGVLSGFVANWAIDSGWLGENLAEAIKLHGLGTLFDGLCALAFGAASWEDEQVPKNLADMTMEELQDNAAAILSTIEEHEAEIAKLKEEREGILVEINSREESEPAEESGAALASSPDQSVDHSLVNPSKLGRLGGPVIGFSGLLMATAGGISGEVRLSTLGICLGLGGVILALVDLRLRSIAAQGDQEQGH